MSQLRIVVAYPDGAMSGGLFRAVRRAKRNIERAGYAARLDLLPSSAVPADATAVIAGTDDSVGVEIDALIERLTASGQLGRGPVAPRTIAVHRGFMPVRDRARMAE